MSSKLRLAAAALLALSVSGCGDDTTTMPAAEPPSGGPRAVEDVPPPAGYRFVGAGHTAMAIPEGWAANKARCGTPQEDTYVIDVAGVDACFVPRPAGVESVEITSGDPRFDFTADRTVEIDGSTAQRQATSCATGPGDVRICTGTVYLPEHKVSFRAESSTGEAEVDALLASIRVLPGQVAVPSTQKFFNNDQERSGETFAAALQAAGLRTEVRQELRHGMAGGFVLAVDPAPGTMAHPGDVVRVTTTGGTGPSPSS